jgi:hypothetical protein
MEFEQYVQNIKETNEYHIDWTVAQKPEVQKGPSAPKKVGSTYYPSIMMWRDGRTFASFDWSDAISPGMMLDAKIANPQHVWESLLSNGADWLYAGSMEQPAGVAPTDAQKLAYQQATITRTTRRHYAYRSNVVGNRYAAVRTGASTTSCARASSR